MPRSPESPWVRYTVALLACTLALIFELWLNKVFTIAVSPFLPGFAAVIVAAAWAGFGPGLVATILWTMIAGMIMRTEPRGDIAGQIVRCAIFLSEGLVLCLASAQLTRSVRIAATSEAWHRRLLDTSGEGIWVTNTDGVITYANPRIAELLGVRVQSPVGRKLDEFFFPEDISMERVRFRNRRAGVKEQFDRRLRRADGSEAWVLACSNPMFSPKDEFIGTLSMMTDITERKRAESALRHSETKYRALFENVLEGVYQSTPDGRILAANPMLLSMLGLTSEQQLNDVNIARDLYVDPNVRRGLLERLERDGSFHDVEYQLRRRDGRIITVHENARVVRDEEGRVLYYEGTLNDITERRHTEDQLRQAQRMEALGRLAGGVAHDFNNILTIISGYAQLVLSDLAPDHPARAHAEQLVKSASGASGLTQHLMSFSQRNAVPASSVDVNELIRTLEPALWAEAGGMTPVAITLTPDHCMVMADRDHIEQMLIALLSSLRSETPSAIEVLTEAVEIEEAFCRRRPVAHPGRYVCISLRITRAGTAAEVRSPVPGMTVGLSTSHAILAHYGGFLIADHIPGRGPAYSIYLPLPSAAAEMAAVYQPSSQPEAAPKGESVLLVEDETLVRELSRDMLERQGFQVVAAASAREAERVCEQGRHFDVLVTDIMMPGMSGDELARRMRQAQPDLKVLFISGYADVPMNQKELEATNAAFLEKPFSADSLGRKIRQILDRN